MHANKNRVTILIRDRDSRAERQEDVGIPGHHHAVTVRLKVRFESLRDVEVHHFFGNALAGDSAAIKSAVAGIDHNNGGWTFAGRLLSLDGGLLPLNDLLLPRDDWLRLLNDLLLPRDGWLRLLAGWLLEFRLDGRCYDNWRRSRFWWRADGAVLSFLQAVRRG